jgi:uncharacterized membrane protein
MEIYQKNHLKFFLAFATCIIVRLIPFRPPNIEPILSVEMPFSKAYGVYAGFLFGFLSVLVYDLLTHTLGLWTIITSSAYGILGLWSGLYFNKKEASVLNYVRFTIMGTLFFDAVTGLSIGPIFFHQSLLTAFVGQIPFTLWHLVGNISFAIFLSPVVYKFIINNTRLNYLSFVEIFNPKSI